MGKSTSVHPGSTLWVQGFVTKDFAALVPGLPLSAVSAVLKNKKKSPARNHISSIKIAFIFRVRTLSNMLQEKVDPSMELLIIPELV